MSTEVYLCYGIMADDEDVRKFSRSACIVDGDPYPDTEVGDCLQFDQLLEHKLSGRDDIFFVEGGHTGKGSYIITIPELCLFNGPWGAYDGNTKHGSGKPDKSFNLQKLPDVLPTHLELILEGGALAGSGINWSLPQWWLVANLGG
jgi:hypothetical protein